MINKFNMNSKLLPGDHMKPPIGGMYPPTDMWGMSGIVRPQINTMIRTDLPIHVPQPPPSLDNHDKVRKYVPNVPMVQSFADKTVPCHGQQESGFSVPSGSRTQSFCLTQQAPIIDFTHQTMNRPVYGDHANGSKPVPVGQPSAAVEFHLPPTDRTHQFVTQTPNKPVFAEHTSKPVETCHTITSQSDFNIMPRTVESQEVTNEVLQCGHCDFSCNDRNVLENHSKFCRGAQRSETNPVILGSGKRRRKSKRSTSESVDEEESTGEDSANMFAAMQQVVEKMEGFYLRDVTSNECFLCHYKCEGNTKKLTKHIQERHFKLPKYQCAHCDCDSVSHSVIQAHEALHDRSDETNSDEKAKESPEENVSDSDGEVSDTVTEESRLKSLSCRICPVSYRTYLSLHRHLRRSHPDELKVLSCHGCPHTATDLPAIIRHKRRCRGERIYKCFVCHCRFECIEDLLRHVAVTEARAPHRCGKCTSTFPRWGALVKHAREAHDNIEGSIPHRRQCYVCGTIFGSKEALVGHLKTHDADAAFACPFCGGRFGRLAELTNHVWRHAPDLLRCKFCCFMTTSPRAMTRHNERHWGLMPYHCMQCKYVTDRRNQMETHVREHDVTEQSCSICNIKAQHADVMQLHLLLQHRPLSSHYSYHCPLCQYGSSIETDILTHLENHMEIMEDGDLHPPADNPKLLDCRDCDLRFKSWQCLHYHHHLRRQEKVFPCSRCHFVTSNRMVLERHFRIHSGEKPFKCGQCAYASGDQTSLRRHMRVHGEGLDKRFQCPRCDYKVHEKFSLKRHIARHDRDNPLQCSKCDFRCVHKGTLTKHLRRYHKPPVESTTEEQAMAEVPREVERTSHTEDHNFVTYYTTNINPEANKRPMETQGFNRPHITNMDQNMEVVTQPTHQVVTDLYPQTGKARTMISHQMPVSAFSEPTKDIHIQYLNEQTIEVSEYFKPRQPEVYRPQQIQGGYDKAQELYKVHIPTEYNKVQNSYKPQETIVMKTIGETSQNFSPTRQVGMTKQLTDSGEEVLVREGYSYTKPAPCTLAVEGETVNALKPSENQCQTCLIVLDSEKSLQNHLKDVHPKDYQFICSKCDFRFCEKRFLVRHSHSHKPKLKCDFCSYTSHSKRSVVNHTRLHTGERPFCCPECPQQFADKNSLARHRATHNQANAIHCEFCDFVAYCKSRMATHRRKHIPSEKIYKCSQCDYRSDTKGMVTRHFIKHTGLKPYSCKHCDFRASDQTVMRRHLLRHNYKEKTIQCPECEYRCHEANHLKKHMRSHSGPLPFQCTLCDFRCNYKGTLTKHIHKHNKVEES